MDIASEYRYRNPVVGPGDLVIGITQSGETADTLAAMRIARERGATVLARHEHHGLAGHARRRRRALHARRPRGRRRRDQDVRLPGRGHVPARRCGSPSCAARCRAERRAELVADLKRIPHCIERAARAASTTPVERDRRRATGDKEFFLYLGRHVGLPVALEGALKLKEISYIATDAYAAGEMKHGPIALLDEAHAGRRRGHRLAGAREGRLQHAGGPRARRARDRRRHRGQRRPSASTPRRSLRIPQTDWMLQPLLAVIPLQLLAYRIARLRGLNVDQPRNLAKTVTVE